MGGARRACPARQRTARAIGVSVGSATRHADAAPASDSAAEVSAPPISGGRRSGRSSSGPSNRGSPRESKASPGFGRSPNGTAVPPPAASWTRIDAAISARLSATRSSNRNDGW